MLSWMDPRHAALLKSPRFWASLIATAIPIAITHGLIEPTGKLHALALALLDLFGHLGIFALNAATLAGLVAVGVWAPPRKPLAQMTDAEREDTFAKNPGLREKYLASLLPPTLPPAEAPPPPVGKVG